MKIKVIRRTVFILLCILIFFVYLISYFNRERRTIPKGKDNVFAVASYMNTVIFN